MKHIIRNLLKDIIIQLQSPFKTIAPGVHILNLHYINPNPLNLDSDYEIFEDFLKYLNTFALFISLEEAIRKINEGQTDSNKSYISFTFDDGFEENHLVIAKMLEKYNTTGAFFINANYIESNEMYRGKFNDRLRVYTKNPMTWDQIRELKNAGHIIGSHTLDHFRLSDLNNAEITHQIELNKQILEEKLKYSCEHFAWPYGLQSDFPDHALRVASNNHNHIYSGTNFKFYKSRDNSVYNRRHIEPFWKKSYIKYFLSFNKQ